jgi:hypothetical protein
MLRLLVACAALAAVAGATFAALLRLAKLDPEAGPDALVIVFVTSAAGGLSYLLTAFALRAPELALLLERLPFGNLLGRLRRRRPLP